MTTTVADIRVPDDEIRRRMRELDKPHHDEEVLKYLHFELGLSSTQLGDVFGVARQTIQKIVREYDWEFTESHGDRAPDKNQKLLSDYERTTLEDLI